MAVKYLSGNRVTALSTDLVGTTVDVAESDTPATFAGNANNASRVEASQMQTTVSTGDVISAISANYYQSEGGSTNTVFGIYTNNSGSPQTLLAQTVEGQPTGTGWKTFDLQTPYTVPASVNGQNLWVGVYADGDSNLYSKQSGAGGSKSYNVGSYSSTMPSTFTVSATHTNVSNMKLVNIPPKLGTTDATATYPTSGVLPTGSTTTDWTLTDTTISNSALNFDSAQASTQNDGVYDLGSTLSNTKWVVRFKYTIANLTNGNQSNINAYLGLFSGTGSFATSQNYMGLSYYTTNSTNYFWATASPSSNSTIWEASSTGRIYDGSVSATTYYVEIKRTSASTVEIHLFGILDFPKTFEIHFVEKH